MFIVTQPVRLASLALVTGVGGPFNAIKAKLFKAPFSPSELSTAAQLDLIQATFAGSAEIAVVWSAPAVTPGKQPFQESQLLLWIATADPSSPETIFGVYYVDAADETKLVGVDLFNTQVQVVHKYDSVQWITTVP